ncbi:MAG: ATP-binding protein [Gammaproteobacteria bacterium]|nr:ATP-binding protein [Gammaproteobacteria bacterium]
MDASNNPYAPGAGSPPPELAGRDALLRDIAVNLKRIKNGRHAKSALLVGLRGVGKTVLLNRIAEDAEEDGIICLELESPEDRALPSILVPQLRKALNKLDQLKAAKEHAEKAWRALASFISVSAECQGINIRFHANPEPGTADTGDLEMDLRDLLVAVGKAAQKGETAVAIFIDELQYVKESELAALITALHKCQQRQLPVTVVGAGLPQLVGETGKAKSYAERMFDFPEIGKLKRDAAAYAIKAPAERAGVAVAPDALDEILAKTEGYPYFLQEWGSKAWLAAENSTITLEDVGVATRHALGALDNSFFRVRYDRCTPTENKYLRAMAELGPGPHRSGDVAARMGRSQNSLAPLRNGLIKKGMIYSPKHGDTAFTVPLFDQFMKRTMPDWS